MESSSSFVQHHEYLAIFLQEFSFEQKAERHVEESSGKEDQRRTCGSDTVVSVFGVKKPPQRKANLFLTFGCFIRHLESRVGSEFCCRLHRETCAEWCVYERSVGAGKPVQGIENQLARTKLDNHHMQISDDQYFEKVFENL